MPDDLDLFNFLFDDGEACAGFPVLIQVGFPPQSGAASPNGKVDLYVANGNDVEGTRIFLSAKGYNRKRDDITNPDGVKTWTRGHGLLVYNERDESDVEGIDPPFVLSLNGGQYTSEGFGNCECDEETAACSCDHTRLLTIEGSYELLCDDLATPDN